MKNTFPALFLIFLFSVAIRSQNNCSEEQIQKAKLFAQTTTSESLKFQIERGNLGDCIRHKWMDKMRNTGVKSSVAAVSFTWQNGLKKFKVEEMNFFEKYDFFYTKNKKLLELVEKNGLKEDLKEAFASRAELILSLLIPRANNIPKKKDSDVVKGKIYLHLFDDEILPLQITTADTEIY